MSVTEAETSFRDTPTIHRNYIYDPEHFKKVTVPALLKAMDEVETVKEIEAV